MIKVEFNEQVILESVTSFDELLVKIKNKFTAIHGKKFKLLFNDGSENISISN